MSAAGDVLAVIGGAVLVIAMVSDAVATLVVTQGRSRRWRPTRIWYGSTWALTRGLGARMPSGAAELVLNIYPAMSLLSLLLLWLVGLAFGWSLVYLGLSAVIHGAGDYGTLLYYAGSSLLTPSFGTVSGAALRALSLFETVTGLGTVALMISYLPALYGAYSRREARLLTLDDPDGRRLTPVRVISLHCASGDVDLLYRFFGEWEMWTAEVLETHVSYPMLALFRSQHPGQSWVSALGVVTDAAALTCACVTGADQREPYFMYRRGRRAVTEIAGRLHIREPTKADWLTRENFDVAWQVLVGAGLPLGGQDAAWEKLKELRAPYADILEQLIDYVVAPHGFWGHSSEATVVQEVTEATAEAVNRARGRRSRE